MLGTYDAALKKASEELEAAMRERDRLNLEIARLTNLLLSLSLAAGIKPLAVVPRGKVPGFTELVMGAVTRADRAMSAREVRDDLLGFGHDLSGYSNPLAHIHQTLNRLAEQGRLRAMGDGMYKRTVLYEALSESHQSKWKKK
jgi:hypothetical protein